MPSNRFADALTLAGMRIRSLFGVAESRATAAVGGFRSYVGQHGLTIGGPRKQVLTQTELDTISAFANSDALADRTRSFSFEATINGRKGRYTTTVNSVLLIEASYDPALREARAVLAELVSAGFLTYTRPDAPPDVSRFQRTANGGGWGPDSDATGISPRGGRVDPRCWSGAWADWPRFAGLKPPGYDETESAYGYRQFPAATLPGLPLPQTWRKLYPTAKLFDTNALSHEAFVRFLSRMTVAGVQVEKGANANPEWHPGNQFFHNGVECYVHDGGVWSDVDARYQYKDYHPWLRWTADRAMPDTGALEVGKTDALWLESMRRRAPFLWEEQHKPAFAHNWASQHYADAVANFVQTANWLQFVCDLGATAHSNASIAHHAVVAAKAYDELGLPAGGSLQDYLAGVARERAAREARVAAGGGTGLSNLKLVVGATESEDRQIANAVLSGACVASVQLMMANPVIGLVALGIVAVATFITNLVFGEPFECHGERLLVKDSRVVAYGQDINGCTGTQGDVFGGNYLPHVREHALRGRPIIRVKDANGREIP